MRNRQGHWISLNDRANLLLGTALTLTGLGVVTGRVSAHNNAGDRAVTVALGKSTVDDARLSRAQAGNAALPPPAGILYDVDSTGDEVDMAPGNGFCETASGRCTLRAAIMEANAHAGDDGIEFGIPESDPNCVDGNCTINLTQALPDLSTVMSIVGPVRAS